MTASLAPTRAARWRRIAARRTDRLPDLAAFCIALTSAGLAALLTALLGGCGGGVGSEGTGSFASGTITGFGSIIVNGVHFDERAAQVQDDDGQALGTSALALGMVVQVNGGAITRAADGSSHAVASSVRTDRALVGPADAVDVRMGRLKVLGQTVVVSTNTVFDPRIVGGLEGVGLGQVLEVYGFYDSVGNAYAATRIALGAAGAGYRISGAVSTTDGSNRRFTLGSQTYSVGALASGMPAVGDQLRLHLQPTLDSNGGWVVIAQRASDDAPPDRDGAELDGLVSAVMSATRFVVAGVTVDASAAGASGSVQLGAKVEVSGTLRGGVLMATRVETSDGLASSFELNGQLSSLDLAARRFVLRGTTVSYGGAEVLFSNGSAAKLSGYTGSLRVEGVLSADRTLLLASRISFNN